MTQTREIITLQLGNYSNYVGAHWWNIQESGFVYDPNAELSEIDNNVLYREGMDLKRNTTYTPRLLLVDLKGCLNHLPQGGTLYEDDNQVLKPDTDFAQALSDLKTNIPWEENKIEVIQKDPVKKPEFQEDLDNPDIDIDSKEYNLTENVETWTDFLYTRYHPRTVNIVNDYNISNEKETFDTFSNGMRIWETNQFEDDFTNKIRQLIEECNNSQGFQVIFDCINGFSGLSLKCLEYLNDEYGKAILAIPVFPSVNRPYESADEQVSDSIRVINTALTYSHLIEQCSLFVPLSTLEKIWRKPQSSRIFPYVDYVNDNLYQTSAILASYLDTISLRYRFKDANSINYLSGFCSDHSIYGKKLAAAALSFPFPMRTDMDLIDCLDKFEGKLLQQISPNTSVGTDYVIQSVCVRGIPQNRLKRPLTSAQKQMQMAAYKCNSVSEMFQLYFQCENHASMSHVCAIEDGLPVRTPYPSQIFDKCLNSKGFISSIEHLAEKKLTSVPMIASIQTSNDMHETIETLHKEASRINISKIPRFKETGLEKDDYVDALENLLSFKDNYEDAFIL